MTSIVRAARPIIQIREKDRRSDMEEETIEKYEE
jgi:hypothetical protein